MKSSLENLFRVIGLSSRKLILGSSFLFLLVLSACQQQPAVVTKQVEVEVEVTRIVQGETITNTVLVTPTPAPADPLARVREKGLYVAFAGEAPWSFITPEGVFSGAEAEMCIECANKLGIKEVFPVTVAFDGLLPGLQARRYDVIVAGMSIRETRLEVAISTQLLYKYGTRVVGKKGDPRLKDLTSWTKVGKSGMKVAAIRGSTEIDDTKQFGVTMIEYPDNLAELADLLAGRIELMGWNDNFFGAYMKANPDTPIEAVQTWDYEGVVSLPGHYFNSEDIALRDAYNDCISELKTNGKMAEILTKWGFSPDTIPAAGPGYPPGAP